MYLLLAAALLAQQPDTVRLPELAVTATRLPLHPGVMTGSHTIITGAELRERGILLVLDALRDVPGLVAVQAGSYGAATSIFLRGGESDYVKVLVDGVPLNLPGGAFNFANLTTERVARIEVIRGPASVLYGADAMTGVVQIFTAPVAPAATPDVALEAGSRGTRRISGSVTTGGRWGGVALQAGTVGGDGWYAFNSAYRNSGLNARITTGEAAPLRAALTVRYGDVRAGFPTNASGEVVDSNQYITERQFAVGVEGERRLARHVTLLVRGTASGTEDGFTNRPDHPGDTVGFGFAAARAGRHHRSGGDLRLSAAGVGPAAVVVGLQYEDERQRQRGATTSNFGEGAFTDRDAFRAARSTRSGYLESAVELRRLLTLTGSARLDDNSAFNTAVSWRLGANLRLGSALTVRAQAGKAFKAPTFAELFANSPFEVGDPTLQPEHARSWEIGVDQYLLGGRVRWSAAWFDQRFRDLIQYASAEPGAPTYGNIAAAASRGLEVTLALTPLDAVTVSAQAAALRTRVTDAGGDGSPVFKEGSRLLRRPGFSASTAVRWQVTPSAVLRLDVHHLGGRDDVDYRDWPAERVRLPARTSSDLAATVRLPGAAAGLTLAGRIENLFDARWEQVAGFVARGRTLQIGLRAGP